MNKDYSTFKPVNDTFFTQNDLFDRIINVKIVQVDEKQNEVASYVIRSDYECVYENNQVDKMFLGSTNKPNYIIRRCQQKPSIKVQYRMVTAGVSTQIDLYMTNFYMFSSDGRLMRNFAQPDFKIGRVEITMGYWGQFRDALGTKDGSSVIKSLADVKPSDLFDISPKNGADQIVIRDVAIVTTDKLPPDSVMHIKGYVARNNESEIGSPKNVKYEDIEGGITSKVGKLTEAESVFFNEITRRFVREGMYSKTSAITDNIPRSPVNADKSGLMSVEEAKQYGVKVYCSEEVKKLVIAKVKDSEGKEQPIKTFFVEGLTLGATMCRLESYLYNDIQFRFLKSGNIVVFTSGELMNSFEKMIVEVEKDFSEEDKGTVFSKKYDNSLPAVYNINIGAGLSTIVCPFFAFIDTFETIFFASRYALTNLVAYLASYDTTIYAFKAIRVDVSFATVDDVNEMQITAVGLRDQRG